MREKISVLERIRRSFGREPHRHWIPGPHKGEILIGSNAWSREDQAAASLQRDRTLLARALEASRVEDPYFPKPDEAPTVAPVELLPGIEIRKVKTNGDKVYIAPAEAS